MIFQVRFQVLEKRVKVPSQEFDCGYNYKFEHVDYEVEAFDADNLRAELEKEYSYENNIVYISSNGSGELQAYHFISIEFKEKGNESWRELELEEFAEKTDMELWEEDHAKREELRKLEKAFY